MIGAILEEEPTEQIVIEYLETCEETETLSAEDIEEINDEQNETQQEDPLGGEEEKEEVEEENLVAEEEEEPVVKTEEEEPVAETEPEEDIRQENLPQEVSSEGRRIRHLQNLFDDLQMNTQEESEFIQETIVNLRNHFLRKQKK